MRNRETTRDIEVSEIGVQYDIFELEFELRADTGSTAAVSQSSAFEEGLEVWYFSDLTYTVFSVSGKMLNVVVLRFRGRRLGFRIILLWLVVRRPRRDISFAG
jgi:hypothetical protein